jgi:DNA topoisomerase II
LERLTGGLYTTQMAEEDYAVMCRRVVDAAGCGASGRLKVTLNGQNVSVASFADYCQMYRQPNSPPVCFVKLNPRWTVGVGLSESGSFESVSFVNGMATSRGGTHVNALVQQIAKYLQEKLDKQDAELSDLITPSLVKRCLYICCDTQIENPTFDSQMKESLTSSPSKFGSSYTLPASFLKALIKNQESGGPGIMEEMVRVARGRQQANLVKVVGGGKNSRRQYLSIPKLEDAHRAGSQQGQDCTLILTEGDSAKSLAVAGLEVIGRDLFGVFPLRGKLLNVRDSTVAKLAKNEEVKALCLILGLDFEKTYETHQERQEMRYGRVMLMTDQDTGMCNATALLPAELYGSNNAFLVL